MAHITTWLHHVLIGLGYVSVWGLCGAGLILSCLSFSGTWLVALGALLAAWLSGASFPGWWTVAGFVLVAVLVDVAESMAGIWGVRKRGGSGLAGLAALVGGLLGLFFGGMIPVPLIGNLIGMMIGSFALVYAVERYRLKRSSPAVQIAMGAVVARVMVVLLKVTVTLGMIAWLVVGIIRAK